MLIIEDNENDNILEECRLRTDAGEAQKNPKSQIISISQLQLTLKNMPKNMDMSNIYSEDLNITDYFDNVVSKSIDDWRAAMENNLKLKLYLKVFLQILFKQNKEK